MNIFKNKISYSKQKIKNNLLKRRIFFASSVLFIFLYFIFLKRTKALYYNENSALIIVSMILGFFAGSFYNWIEGIINSFLKKTDLEISKAKKGDEGENGVYLKLIKILPAPNYTIYKNFKIKDTKFDFDFLIVGPKGLIAVEVKNSAYNYIFTEENVVKYKISEYSRTETILFGKSDPRKKLINRSKYLNYLINSDGLKNIAIRKLLVFIDSDVEIRGKSKIFIVKNLNELNTYFNSLNEDKRFTKDFCKLLNKKLESLQ